MNPLVTIYVVNHNYGKFLKEAIDSAINQTYDNIEILVFDNGSTDNSKEILKSYSKIKIFYNNKKLLIPTINQAINESSGKFILRLDADDVLKKDAIKILADRFTENIAMVFGSYEVIDEKNQILYKRIRNFDNKVNKIHHNPAHGACSLIRKEILKKIGGYDENFNSQDGYYLWLKLIFNYQVVGIEDVVFSYRRHNNNLTNNYHKILESRMLIQENYLLNTKFSWENIYIIILINDLNKLQEILNFLDTSSICLENVYFISKIPLDIKFDINHFIEPNFKFEVNYILNLIHKNRFNQIVYFNTDYFQAPPFLIKHLVYNNFIYKSSKSLIVLPLSNSIFYLNTNGKEEKFLERTIKREDNDYYINTGVGMSINNVVNSNKISYIEIQNYMNIKYSEINERFNI